MQRGEFERAVNILGEVLEEREASFGGAPTMPAKIQNSTFQPDATLCRQIVPSGELKEGAQRSGVQAGFFSVELERTGNTCLPL